MAEIIAPSDYSVHGPWLHVRRKGVAPHLLTYWGHGLRPLGARMQGDRALAHHWLRLAFEAGELKTLAAGLGQKGPWRSLSLNFSRARTIKSKDRGLARVVIGTARSDRDHDQAMSIIARRHYLNPRPGGVHLIARLIDAKRPSPIIGCLTLERLTYSAPRGREEIYRRMGLQLPSAAQRWTTGFRKKELQTLGVAWISRVAVEEKYEGSGLATALCDVACEAAP